MTGRVEWLAQARERIISHWLLKLPGICAGIAAFMWVYFLLLRHPQFAVTVMPLTALDRRIGFEPWALVPYASLWLYIALVPALLLRREVSRYLAGVATLSVVGLGTFLLWPTAVPAPGINWAHFPVIHLLKSVDASGNACPSLHVAFSIFTALWLHRLLGWMRAPTVLRLGNAAWCVLIVYSALATKQHVAVDAAAGALLGAGVGAWQWLAPSRPPAHAGTGRPRDA